ncbi:hypothetical protein MUO32_23715 [Shinella sp. CPCC 101442]|uniref:hypothetical protein n=1 Tax=Shinella sp. CPCC 101442 TaxID=2932265 RepID=UPI002152D144|nr:hypothetical protein [Shinella sp. CPCC 101442]MCR6502040.1 hypothetical protein [Shinella sp. CPCC 101442]
MSLNSVLLFADKQHWSVIGDGDGDETLHPFRLHKHAASFANGQRIRLGFPLIDFTAYNNANLPVEAG